MRVCYASRMAKKKKGRARDTRVSRVADSRPTPEQDAALRAGISSRVDDDGVLRISGRSEATAAAQRVVVVELVGQRYELWPPKGVLAIKLARAAQKNRKSLDNIDTFREWMDAAFGKPVSKAIWKRLEDPHDDLDVGHIYELVVQVSEVMSGNLSTSS